MKTSCFGTIRDQAPKFKRLRLKSLRCKTFSASDRSSDVVTRYEATGATSQRSRRVDTVDVEAGAGMGCQFLARIRSRIGTRRKQPSIMSEITFMPDIER
ncbi:hypothetical protein BTW08_16585 [Salinicola sp. MH3R3-1]|nr:hypothetical protein BTW08_16585 [Salinicola sp. MH3R3-1]